MIIMLIAQASKPPSCRYLWKGPRA